ncbi:MAG: MFS transporter [Dehalococcoidia bacterium]|nr:MFS transporter [Dehalococcoidia bacterium]
MRWPRRIFYGWWIVGASIGLQALVSGLFSQAYGAYVVVLKDHFGWSQTTLSGASSLAQVESGLLGPIQGALVDRLGARTVVRVGIVFFSAGFLAFSQVNSPVTFYLSFFLIAIGSSLAGFLTLTIAVVKWFDERRTTALGVSATGFGLGALLVPLVVVSLDQLGWRGTAMAASLAAIVVGLPLAQLVRDKPRPAVGDLAPGEVAGQGTETDEDADSPDFTLREAMRTPSFWYISAGHGSALLVVSAVQVHLISHVIERLGYSLGQASLIVVLMTILQLSGQIGGGIAGDRFNKRAVSVVCMIMHATALLSLAYATGLAMVMAFAVLHGLAWGTRGPLMGAIRADYFGRRHFGAIMGFSQFLVMVGQISGPLVAGVLYDLSGSYEPGFTVLAVMALLGSLFFVAATRPDPPARVQAREAAGLVTGPD